MGMGCLAEELTDARVTDVLVNGDGSVWVDRGAGVTPTGRRLESTEARALAVRLAGQAGRRLDDAQPWVDGLLPGGIRLHAILPPLVLGGPHLSLRIPRVAPEGLAGLVRLGMLDEDCRPLVEAIIRARLSHLVVGGTGTGKTTLVGGLVAACPPTDRIVIVEDDDTLRRMLVRLNYDGANEDLIVNEAQAFLMHTPDDRAFNAASLGIAERQLSDLRRRFMQGAPRLRELGR
jgi:pilus assembly protein CpaF